MGITQFLPNNISKNILGINEFSTLIYRHYVICSIEPHLFQKFKNLDKLNT